MKAIAFVVMFAIATTAYSQTEKSETQTYTGQIVKIDTKTKTLTIKGPRGGLTPDQASKATRGGGGAATTGGRRGRSGGIATPRGADTRVFEDVEIKIVWTQETEVESMDGKLGLANLKIGDYVLVDTIKYGKKIRAVKINRSTA